jgi:hypothetical protein
MALASDMLDMRLWHVLNHLESSHWCEVDCNGGRQAHEFYTPDAPINPLLKRNSDQVCVGLSGLEFRTRGRTRGELCRFRSCCLGL